MKHKLFIDVEIPQFPGWEFNRVGSPLHGEGYYHAGENRIVISWSNFDPASYRLVYKPIPPVKTIHIEKWYPVARLSEIKLTDGEIIIFRRPEGSNPKSYQYATHWGTPSNCFNVKIGSLWQEFAIFSGAK